MAAEVREPGLDAEYLYGIFTQAELTRADGDTCAAMQGVRGLFKGMASPAASISLQVS